MKYLITGGSGMVGTRITEVLLKNHQEVNWLSSSKKSKQGVNSFYWNIKTNEFDNKCLEGVDVIIHLAGTGIADKNWTPERKVELIDSRIKSTALLLEAIKKTSSKPKAIIAASAIGIYKNKGNDLLDENATIGNDFLATLTHDWEKAMDGFEALNIRTVKVRIGIVLAPEGGYLNKIAAPAKFGFAAALGDGKAMTSWIHIDDLVSMFLFFSNKNNLNGVYNAVAPHPVSNYEMTSQIAKALHKPFFMPNVPSFALKLVFGEMASVILMSQNISCKKIIETGFEFKHVELPNALQNLLSK